MLQLLDTHHGLRHRLRNVIFASLIIVSSSFAFSAEYYTVRESKAAPQEADLNPFIAFEEAIETSSQAVLSLMNWESHDKKMENPTAPYNRLAQYGSWVTDREAGTGCLNTRARVLVRQSQADVTFNNKGCIVLSGKWQDAYTGRSFSRASEMDIDHVVPLKNTYTSGAWKWDKKKRCLYANFMENEFHLIAVEGDVNKQKGDSGPDRFMPALASYRCEYLTHWLKIKLIWNLAMSSSEGQAIEDLVRDNHCDTADLSISSSELQTQRSRILAKMSLCER